jgi:hypothetical protein
MRHRFKVIEYASGYAVRDTKSGKEHWMSDGVDVLFTKGGKPRSPGTEAFRRDWERALNGSPDETAEAYFGGE